MSTEDILDNPVRSFDHLKTLAACEELETPESYKKALEATHRVLIQQGGLVHLPDVPTIVIADLHARREMLIAILGTQLAEGQRVFELVQQGRINIVCVGDIVHSEARDHWVINLDGEWTPELLEREMVRSLGAALMVMYLKLQFPDHFYCLRGNHDDIAEEMGSYGKYVGIRRDEQGELVLVDGRPVLTADRGESQIVKAWVLEREGWGQEFLDAWTRFDRALPLFAQGSYYVVTHTLPLKPLAEADLRDPNRPMEVTMELTRSRGINREAIEATLQNLGISAQTQRWFYGHSVVEPEVNGGKYAEDLDGLLVRLNNPGRHVFAYVPAAHAADRFDPTRDVYML